jgi:peptidoglycan/xylan/chitin deacetylase (PgdA/CDA1 family)
MLRSLAKIATQLEIDSAANKLLEALYSNMPDANPRLARRFQILAYHKVSPDPHPFFEPVHPDVFEKQIEFLSRYYRVMPLLELVERSGMGEVPTGAVAITFDDGYRDNYEYAFPVLKKYGVGATIFVSTGAIETGELLWHDRVFDAFRYTTVSRARLRETGIPELILEPMEARHRSILPVLQRAKALYGEERLRFVEQVEEALKPSVDETWKDRMLTWQQIRQMHASGIDFGSHTVSHPVLSRIPRYEMVKELIESKEQISRQLGVPTNSFAYPNGHAGDYNDEVQAVLKDAGYVCAVTSEFGFNHVFSNPFELRRGQPWHHQIELFRLAFFLQRHGVN